MLPLKDGGTIVRKESSKYMLVRGRLIHVSSSQNFAAIPEVVLAVVLRLNSLFSAEKAIFTTLSIVKNIQKMDVFVG